MEIEQAKGAIAEALRIDIDEAFDLLRNYSRNTNQVLREVARAVVTHSLRITELRAHDTSRSRPS